MTAVSATGFAATDKAGRYVQQLCRHWEHHLKVEHADGVGRIVFPKDARGADWPGDARVTLEAKDDGIAIRVDASAPRQLDGLRGAVERHIDRFAFREDGLKYDWG